MVVRAKARKNMLVWWMFGVLLLASGASRFPDPGWGAWVAFVASVIAFILGAREWRKYRRHSGGTAAPEASGPESAGSAVSETDSPAS